MHYEINVAKNGVHQFATAPRSITDQRHCVKMYKLFRERFPTEEGYSLTIRKCYQTSNPMQEDELSLLISKYEEK